MPFWPTSNLGSQRQHREAPLGTTHGFGVDTGMNYVSTEIVLFSIQ